MNPGRTNTELGRTAAAFDDMLDALEGAEQTAVGSELRTRRFVADAAHELRTPIAGVAAAAEALIGADPQSDPALRDRMQVLVVREAMRAGRLVDDLLSLATIESGLQLQREPVELFPLLQAQTDRIRVLSAGLEVRLDGTPCTLPADPLRLTQVLTNLLENARRYTRRPGRVLVQLHPTPAEAQILVVDDGPGVPVADRERIFDRLVRLDESRSNPGDPVSPPGFGLGLAIARGIARAHGGELSCVEPPDPWTGAAFLLRLPMAQPPQHRDEW